MRVVVLAGGVGGARFLRGLREYLSSSPRQQEDWQITAVVNVADDIWINGLRVTPDLDSIMYTLANENDDERGWGRSGETERVSAELAAYGVGESWFTLGDLDIGTNLARTYLLNQGYSLTEVTNRLCARWNIGVQLLPATDDVIETHVHTLDGSDLHFQEWWVKHRAKRPVARFEFRGAKDATPNAEVLQAIAEADRVILAPSNPVVSVGAVLAIPAIHQAVVDTHAPVVGVSPIIGGRVVRGMADACLSAIGVPTEAGAVGLHYGARSHNGLIDAWLVDSVDRDELTSLNDAGIRAEAVPLWMSNLELSQQLAADAMRV